MSEKRKRLAMILRAYVRDLMVAGPQYAPMADVLKECADELDAEVPRVCPVAPDDRVYDGDGAPGLRHCEACED
jgi:hypothetical protein